MCWCRGITGFHGRKHTALMRGIRHSRGGRASRPGKKRHNAGRRAGIRHRPPKPVRSGPGANAAVSFIPPSGAAEGMIECADAGLDICVCITENVPVQDMVKVRCFLKDKRTHLIGPNGPRVLSPPGQTKLGIMPLLGLRTGDAWGVVSRSGSLNYEDRPTVDRTGGWGQSTCIGIGGDPVKGTSMLDAVRAFAADSETLAVVLIGEIGGGEEQETALWIRDHMQGQTPRLPSSADRTAPPGKRMGPRRRSDRRQQRLC